MIHYGRQSINKVDIRAVVRALKGDFITTGPLVEQFENELEKKVGSPCVVVSSGTAALQCAYAAIDLQSGDEVITPPITFIATQAAAVFFGAKIVFVDVQEDTGNIDPKAVLAAITPRTKAIVAVDFAGHPADLDELKELAYRHSLVLIEDASHSIGSTYRGLSVGSIADITTFSFYPTKNMTTGEGGAISTSNPDFLKKARRFSRQGLIRNPEEFKITSEGPWHQEVQEFGVNLRLPDLLCALGLSQLKRLGEFKEKRSEVYEQYSVELQNAPEVILPTKKEYVDPMWHLYPIHVPVEKRKVVYLNLHRSGIAAQVNYMPAYWHPVWSKEEYKVGDFPVSDNFYQTEISIPMHVDLKDKDIKLVSKVIQETLRS
jgi:dTDP-4-amino-4,6-dideoxygalactose transaminase